MKTFRVCGIYCDDQRCHDDGRYFISWDGMRAGPYCLKHARSLVRALRKKGYVKEHGVMPDVVELDLTREQVGVLHELVGWILEGNVGTDIFQDAEEFRILHSVSRRLDRVFPGQEWGTHNGMKATLKDLEARDAKRNGMGQRAKARRKGRKERKG